MFHQDNLSLLLHHLFHSLQTTIQLVLLWVLTCNVKLFHFLQQKLHLLALVLNIKSLLTVVQWFLTEMQDTLIMFLQQKYVLRMTMVKLINITLQNLQKQTKIHVLTKNQQLRKVKGLNLVTFLQMVSQQKMVNLLSVRI